MVLLCFFNNYLFYFLIDIFIHFYFRIAFFPKLLLFRRWSLVKVQLYFLNLRRLFYLRNIDSRSLITLFQRSFTVFRTFNKMTDILRTVNMILWWFSTTFFEEVTLSMVNRYLALFIILCFLIPIHHDYRFWPLLFLILFFLMIQIDKLINLMLPPFLPRSGSKIVLYVPLPFPLLLNHVTFLQTILFLLCWRLFTRITNCIPLFILGTYFRMWLVHLQIVRQSMLEHQNINIFTNPIRRYILTLISKIIKRLIPLIPPQLNFITKTQQSRSLSFLPIWFNRLFTISMFTYFTLILLHTQNY